VVLIHVHQEISHRLFTLTSNPVMGFLMIVLILDHPLRCEEELP
jgi:hypothetical protein